MKVLVLTGSVTGAAAHAVPLLFKEQNIEIGMVILNEGKAAIRTKQFLKKIKKVFKIGLFGAINGVRMRKWFAEDAEKLLPPANLETFCMYNNINFERTPAINCDRTRELFKKANADVGISLGNSFISRSVFTICRFGMINVHGEILPEYQNAQSVIWQLYNNSAETGFTIHQINQNIDRGNILYQEKFPIHFKDTLRDTVAFNCAEITRKAAAALVKVINNYTFYDNNSTPQGRGAQYTTPNSKQYKRIKKQFSILKKQLPHNA
jgi:methionyl-tRNA formyltransferase